MMSSDYTRTILVTAFEPFGADTLNPAQMILDRLPDTVGGCRIHKLLLPVDFIKAPETALSAYDALSPAAVIMLGQAGGRDAVTPEMTAKNRIHAAFPDNAGYQPADMPVVADGPDTLTSTLPNEKIVAALSARGIPAALSDDAGAYVCNCLLYRMLFFNGGEVPTGFIHVPFIPEQEHTDQPFMALDDAYTGILTVVKATADALDR